MSRKRSRKKRAARGSPTAAASPSAASPAPIEAEGKGAPRGRWPLDVLGLCLGLGAVSLVFVALKMFAMNAYAGDDHIYVYQAHLISQGATPYADFAMAHPPVQALFCALVLEIFGYQFLLIRLLPVLWCLAGGWILAILVHREHGAVAGTAAAGLYLLSYEPLRAASHFTGVNMTIAILLGAFLAFRSDRIRLCAVLCVAAVFTRLYAAPGVIALCAWALLADRRAGSRLVAWGAGIGALAFVATGVWTGFGDAIHNMLAYHAQKTPMKPGTLENMRDTVLFHNAPAALLFTLSAPALLAAVHRAWRGGNRRDGIYRRARLAISEAGVALPIGAAAAAVLFLVILLSMDRVWMYYFVPSFPLAAVSGGWLVSRWTRAASAVARARFRPRASGLPLSTLVGGSALLVAFLAGWGLSPSLESRLGYYQREMKKPEDERVHTYTWRPGLLPGFANDLTRRTVWRDERVIGERYFSFTYLLWHESRILDIADEVVEEIERRTGPDDSIFGDSGTVPLFAMLSGRRIASNEVDTNIQRYRSGSADPKEMVRRIDAEGTKLVVLRRRFGVAAVRELKALLREKYRPVRRFRSSDGKVFTMYERREGVSR